jgi:hypothetical protein
MVVMPGFFLAGSKNGNLFDFPECVTIVPGLEVARMARGGARAGAGRPPGARDRRPRRSPCAARNGVTAADLAKAERAVTAKEGPEDPQALRAAALSYLAGVMRDEAALPELRHRAAAILLRVIKPPRPRDPFAEMMAEIGVGGLTHGLTD